VKLDGYKPVLVDLNDPHVSENDLWIHNSKDRTLADILVRFFDDPNVEGNFPRPFGIFYQEDRFTYEEALNTQLQEHIESAGTGDLSELLKGGNTWTIT